MNLFSELKSDYYFKKAQQLFRQNNYAASIENYIIAANLNNNDSRIYLHLALAQSRTGDFQAALTTLEKASEIAPNNFAVFLSRGKLLYENGVFKEAIKELDTCIKFEPSNQIAQNYKALSLFAIGEIHNAVSLFRESDITNNLDVLCYFCMDFEKYFYQKEQPLDIGNYIQEIKSPDTSLNSLPTEKSPVTSTIKKGFAVKKLIRKGDNHFYNKEYNKAEEYYLKAYILDNNNAEVLWGLGTIYYHKSEFTKSLEFLHKAIEGKIENPLPYSYLGKSYLKLQKIDEAIEWFEKVRCSGPEDFSKYYHLGICYIVKNERNLSFSCFYKGFSQYFIGTFEECFLPLKEKVFAIDR